MAKTWKMVALVMLAALGMAASAYGTPQRWWWPMLTTTTAATTATTTAPAGTTTVTTVTTVATATDPVTTTVPETTTTAIAIAAPVATASVSITRPLNGMYYSRGSSSVVAGQVVTNAGGTITCTVDWGDGSLPRSYPATQVAPGVYQCCPVSHLYLNAGVFAITLTTSANGVPVGFDSVRINVL
jgi:hypothetical protein